MNLRIAAYSNPPGGQLDIDTHIAEEDSNLPTPLPKKQNLQYFYNQSNHNYDVIDIGTGAIISQEKFEISNSVYTLALADYICDLIRNGKTLKSISEMDDMPGLGRMYGWQATYPEFQLRMKAARKQRAETFADRALEIALERRHKDDVPNAKLGIDMLKWRAEKADPDEFGTKKESAGPQTASINITLHTGVLDSPLPKDIIVDEFGQFKGFTGDPFVNVDDTVPEAEYTELNTDRFQETDNGEEDVIVRQS